MSAPYPPYTPPTGDQPTQQLPADAPWGQHPDDTTTPYPPGPGDPSDAPERPARNGKAKRLALMIGVPVLALLLGLGIGAAAVDPTASTEYRDLARERSAVSAERDALVEERDALTSDVEARDAEIGTLESEVERLEGEIGDLPDREKAVGEKEAAIASREKAVAEKETAVLEREKAVGIAEETAAANSFGNGTWTIGEDIAPGVYKVKEAVSGMCYWSITRTGSNGSDIIDNDIVTGGFPQVTVSEGHTFESSRCGEWTKVG